ncbi:MAG: flagellar biosynthetic protein FliO [Ethanoligenens sp.]|uniref:FliO/MopB family protein n=1 Tax=Ethanoligenens sp. TaxID=2099655 RepID=UPI0039EBEAAC
MGAIIKLLLTVVIVIIFFFLAYVVTRVVAGGNFLGVRGKNIRILEKLPLSRDSSILLLRAVDKVLVVGVTPSGMTTLRELAPDAVELEEPPATPQDFATVFKIALRDSVPRGRVRERVSKWLHVEKDEEHDKHL